MPANSRQDSTRSPRLAVVSTPRSGNTWVRNLLGKALGCESLSVHRPGDLNWDALASGCILQIHWRPTNEFIEQLHCHGFQVLVLARHPLDVLISILHFALHDNSTLDWLDGEGGNERCIRGVLPCSQAFLDYATSTRAASLLSISRQWWRIPGVLRLRFEDMVANPIAEAMRLLKGLDARPILSIETAVADTTLGRLRAETRNPHHFWQGRPGLWKKLLTAEAARTIANFHAGQFSDLAYACDPDTHLQRREADKFWLDMIRDELSVRLWGFVRTRHLLDVNASPPVKSGLLADAKPLHAMISDRLARTVRGLVSASR